METIYIPHNTVLYNVFLMPEKLAQAYIKWAHANGIV